MSKKLFKTHKINAFQIKMFFFFFLTIFLIFNIASSQIISPAYYDLVEGGRKNAAEYLKRIRSLPVFENELERHKKIYGEIIVKDVFEEENAVEEEIKNFERILEKNTYSRDILYSLYLLNIRKGDEKAATEYLEQVRKIDPSF